jgi:hypothetical protein
MRKYAKKYGYKIRGRSSEGERVINFLHYGTEGVTTKVRFTQNVEIVWHPLLAEGPIYFLHLSKFFFSFFLGVFPGGTTSAHGHKLVSTAGPSDRHGVRSDVLQPCQAPGAACGPKPAVR